jgi:hypothetical protein
MVFFTSPFVGKAVHKLSAIDQASFPSWLTVAEVLFASLMNIPLIFIDNSVSF